MNRDIEEYNSRITNTVVQSPRSLYQWPSHVTGVHIDARSVTEAKENPKVYFDYEEGYEALAGTKQEGKQTVVARSFATGGTQPPKQAAKRFRAAAEPGSDGVERETLTDLPTEVFVTVEDLMNPADHKKQAPPASVNTGQGCPSDRTSRPIDSHLPQYKTPSLPHRELPIQNQSCYYGSSPAPAGIPKTSAHAEEEAQGQIQVTAHSGRKIRHRDPRASSKTNGIEVHC